MKRVLALYRYQFPVDMRIAANNDTFGSRPSRFRPVVIASLIAKRALRHTIRHKSTAKKSPVVRSLKLISNLSPIIGDGGDHQSC